MIDPKIRLKQQLRQASLHKHNQLWPRLTRLKHSMLAAPAASSAGAQCVVLRVAVAVHVSVRHIHTHTERAADDYL